VHYTGVGSPLLTSQDLADLFDPVNATGITPSSIQQLTATLSAGSVPGVLAGFTPLACTPGSMTLLL
jgi:hypothetical protein